MNHTEELIEERKKFLADKKKRLAKLKKADKKKRLDHIEMQMTLLNYDMTFCPKCKTLQNIAAMEIIIVKKKGRYLNMRTTCTPGCENFNKWFSYRILSDLQIEKLKGKKKKADENEKS